MAMDSEKHLEEINITDIVSGKNLGNFVQFAKRSLTAWAKDETHGLKDSAEYVSLQAHVNMAESAMKLSPKNTEALSASARARPVADNHATRGGR